MTLYEKCVIIILESERDGVKVFGKFVKILKVLWWCLIDDENLILHLMEEKALKILKDCREMEINDVEELEDFIFHINTYYEIPFMVKEMRFPDWELDELPPDYLASYIEEVETQRAVERDFIFEHAKVLSLGFDI